MIAISGLYFKRKLKITLKERFKVALGADIEIELIGTNAFNGVLLDARAEHFLVLVDGLKTRQTELENRKNGKH